MVGRTVQKIYKYALCGSKVSMAEPYDDMPAESIRIECVIRDPYPTSNDHIILRLSY